MFEKTELNDYVVVVEKQNSQKLMFSFKDFKQAALLTVQIRDKYKDLKVNIYLPDDFLHICNKIDDWLEKEWDRTKTREYPQPPKDRFATFGA